jgi:hypothetical protein
VRPREDARDIRRVGAVAAQDAVVPERKEIAALVRGRPFSGDRVGIRETFLRLAPHAREELREFLLGPQVLENVGCFGLQLLQSIGVPRGRSVARLSASAIRRRCSGVTVRFTMTRVSPSVSMTAARGMPACVAAYHAPAPAIVTPS